MLRLTRAYIVAALLAIVSIATKSGAQRPLNLDFEMRAVGTPTQPWGWQPSWSAFAGGPAAEFVLDSTTRADGQYSLRIVARDSGNSAPARSLQLQVPAGFALGKELRVSGKMRTSALNGVASFSLEAWGNRIVLAADTARISGSLNTTPWTPISLRINVPRDSTIHSVVFTPSVQGAGTAWFDAMTLTIDGVPTRTLPQSAPSPSGAELRWLAGRSTPLRSVTPTKSLEVRAPDGNADLARFDRIVGDARVIGLGESTHGTREFFQLKHRLLRHVVETQQFDVFAIEANQRAVRKLNEYVMGGPGTARDAMRVMFAVWNTAEMAELVEWIREYNASHSRRPVHFIGYDMQDHREPIDSLLAFLAPVDAALRDHIAARTADYRATRSYVQANIPEATRKAWSATADSIASLLNARRSAWLAAARTQADSARVEWAVHDGELYRQAARVNATLFSPDRDSLMAANLDWAIRTLYPNSRTVVWAHDVHVSHGGDAKRSFNSGAQMGAHIKHTYKHTYRAFSFLTADGRYRATRGLSDYTMIEANGFPAPAGSMESILKGLPRPASTPGVMVDLRVAESDPAGRWLWRPRPIRHIGYASYDYGFEILAVMPLDFDGVFFVEHTTASRP